MPATPPSATNPSLDRLVTSLPGVGPQRAFLLEKLGVLTVNDLLLHRPRRYEDRRHFLSLGELRVGEPAVTRGRIVALGVKWFAKHTKSIFEFILEDGASRLHCRWWNQPFMDKYFATGQEIVAYGKLLSLKPRNMDHPETEVIEPGEEASIHLSRIAPIYPLTEGLQQRWLRGLIWRALAAAEPQLSEPWSDLANPLQAAGFLTRRQALRKLHFPDELTDPVAAVRRLALDEFIEMQRQIQARRKTFESKAVARPCGGDNRLIKPFLAHLGFKLTSAQTRVLRQVRQDMTGPHPMRRLLQGDVGSGKTAVAACSALMAIESGYEVALMAPTEALAGQHYHNFKSWFGPLGIRVGFQTGSTKIGVTRSRASGDTSTAKRPPNFGRATGSLTVGTHALIESGFAPENLGLVIVDEQHKFGVAQREKLVKKGHYPHLLVMTATPIPRTLGLTLYGELDNSILDELPPGRGRTMTFIRTSDKLPKVWSFIRDRLRLGRQAYVVYPRVEESGPDGIKAVTQEFDHVREALKAYRVGLLHGRLNSEAKEAALTAFRNNTTQVLLATSLIEVGLDVPNATIMLVENAEQFGLAQLHQLRGRIGRGSHDSYCILVASARSKDARQRLAVLEKTTDGFRIAEEDLRLRGPGELLGQQQSGAPKLRFGDLTTDEELIHQARVLAGRLG
jgi:ATP-dependent DNA helicase RecG